MTISGGQCVIDVLKLAPTIIAGVENEAQRIVLQNLVDRCDKVEICGMDFRMLVRTSVDISYTNPETGVSATLPKGSKLGWEIAYDYTNKDYYAPHGIYTVRSWSDSGYVFDAWDCTDYYGEEDTWHPRFRTLIGALSMIDLLMMHATNLDEYDGGRSTNGAKSKYAGSFKMKLENIPDNIYKGSGRHHDEDEEDDSYFCDGCEEYYNYDGNEVAFLDGTICPRCYTESTASCGACGNRLWTENMYWSEPEQVFLCEYHQHTCEFCNNVVSSDLNVVGTLEVCTECFGTTTVCIDCGVVMKSTSGTEVETGKRTCEYCSKVREGISIEEMII